MGEFSIKIKVAGSEYPMKLNAADEEIVMKAASIINERYYEFEKQYPNVREKKDILAMAFLQIMVDEIKGFKDKDKELNRLKVFVQEVNEMVDGHEDKIKQYKG
jgi:cell division protein ZapA